MEPLMEELEGTPAASEETGCDLSDFASGRKQPKQRPTQGLSNQRYQETVESESHYRALIERIPAITYIISGRPGAASYVSPQIRHYLGFTQKEWVETEGIWLQQIHPEDRDRVLVAATVARETGEPLSVEYRIYSRDGELLWFRDEAVIFRSPGDDNLTIHGMMLNMTPRRQAEAALAERTEQMLQMQKMDAVGRMAGGIAHDFNNLLTAILGHCEIATRQCKGPGRLHHELNSMQSAAERAQSLTAQLLSFSRKKPHKTAIVDCGELLKEMEPMLRPLIGENIEMILKVEPGLDSVTSDPGLLQQAVMNLVVNARDAMGGKGCLILMAKGVVYSREMALRYPDVREGRYVELSVEDDGAGMSEATLRRLFEPFFTTKKEGHGTGFGLSMVYGTVKQSGGHVRGFSAGRDTGRSSAFSCPARRRTGTCPGKRKDPPN